MSGWLAFSLGVLSTALIVVGLLWLLFGGKFPGPQ